MNTEQQGQWKPWKQHSLALAELALSRGWLGRSRQLEQEQHGRLLPRCRRGSCRPLQLVPALVLICRQTRLRLQGAELAKQGQLALLVLTLGWQESCLRAAGRPQQVWAQRQQEQIVLKC